MEHHTKLWSYVEEVVTNPGSTVKLDVLPIPYGGNYFSKFNFYFDGVKKGGCKVY